MPKLTILQGSGGKTPDLGYRRIDDNDDKSMRKGDLTATGLYHDGKTILDVGITHPTIDTYINNSSSEAPRGYAANIYANRARFLRPCH